MQSTRDRESTAAGQTPCEPLSQEALQDFLSRSLGDGRSPARIEVLERRVTKRRCDWRGARLFERLTVRTPSGETPGLFLKYRRRHPDPAALVAPMDREARVYREVLPGGPPGTAKLHGFEERDGSTLLLLEFVTGKRLKKIEALEVWQAVAKWLARLHRHFSLRADELRACEFLARHDGELYSQWACRAAEAAGTVSAEAGSCLERVLSRYGRVAGLLGGAPATLIHGEFYCTNLIVSGEPESLRVCPFDWETAASGCGALDLTYLLRQRLGIDEPSLIRAYLDGWREPGGRDLSREELEAQIVAARAHELLCRLWSRIHCRETPPEKIGRYAEKLKGYLDRL